MAIQSQLVCASARAAFTLSLIASLSVSLAAEDVRHTVIATSGAAAPAGGNYSTFSKVAMNERGLIAFDAILSGIGNTGVFLSNGGVPSVVALGSNSAAGPDQFAIVTSPSITSSGEVFFNTDTGIFRTKGSATAPVVRNGDAAPGGGTLTPQIFFINRRGVVAFLATVSGSSTTTGIFQADGKSLIAIGRDNTPPPTGGLLALFGGFAINQRPQVPFYSTVTGGSSEFGIFQRDGDQLKAIYATNGNAPGGGQFGDFSDPVINEAGQVGTLGFALQNTTHSFGIFVGNGERTAAIALGGNPAPSGGNYAAGTFSPLVLNDAGQMLFNIGLSGGTSTSGIFRGDGRNTETIALQGGPAPGTTGTFAGFQNMRMLNDGRFVFIGQLTMGVGGVNRSNNRGIWMGSSPSDVRLVARAGDVIGGSAVCVPIGLEQFDMNNQGVAWISHCNGPVNGKVIFSAFDQF